MPRLSNPSTVSCSSLRTRQFERTKRSRWQNHGLQATKSNELSKRPHICAKYCQITRYNSRKRGMTPVMTIQWVPGFAFLQKVLDNGNTSKLEIVCKKSMEKKLMHIRKRYDSMHIYIYRSIYFIHLEFIWYNTIQQVWVGARIQNNLERANFSWARVTGSVDDFFELAKL